MESNTGDLKRVKELLEKSRQLLREEKIPASEKIKALKINHRIRSRFGRCIKTAGGYEIELSGRMMAASDRDIETVLLHELLHTCPGCMNHGKRWAEYAAWINRKYGYKISTTTTYESLGLENPGSRESVRYMVRCKSCGAEYPRKRMCSLIRDVDRYRCGKCGGKLEIL